MMIDTIFKKQKFKHKKNVVLMVINKFILVSSFLLSFSRMNLVEVALNLVTLAIVSRILFLKSLLPPRVVRKV